MSNIGHMKQERARCKRCGKRRYKKYMIPILHHEIGIIGYICKTHKTFKNEKDKENFPMTVSIWSKLLGITIKELKDKFKKPKK